jgi:U3 small nucleolar RNA-associated protein 20
VVRRLAAYLSLFAKVKHPKGIVEQGRLKEVIFTCLGKTDAGLQKSALEALLNWKDPHMTPYGDRLFRLVDDATLFDELTLFPCSTELEVRVIRTDHRAGLLPVLVEILYVYFRLRLPPQND